MKIGVFGGTFDPPHFGHEVLIDMALMTERVDKVFVFPVVEHPYPKHPHVSFFQRLEMCRMAFGTMPHVEVQNTATYAEKTKYSYDLLKAVQEREQCTPVLIVGDDITKDEIRQRWYRGEELVDQFEIYTWHRNGLSSTLVRDLILKNDETVSTYLRPSIQSYIRELGLYGDKNV